MYNPHGSLYVNEKMRKLNDEELARREVRRSLVNAAQTFAAENPPEKTPRRQPRFRSWIPRLSAR